MAKTLKEKLTIHKVLKLIQNDILIAVRKVLVEHGLKRKSDLYKSIELKAKYNSMELFALDYFAYVGAIQTRKKLERKVPIDALIHWIRHYRIPVGRSKGRTVVQLAYQIQSAIYRNGIKGKAYNVPVAEVTEQIMKDRLEDIFGDIIIQDFDEFDPTK